jgi:hypothetical protein
VLEVFRVDFKQRDFASFVFVVAFVADLLFHMLTVQALFGEFILSDLFVTAFAQVRLGGLFEVFMTGRAIAFKFGMPLYYLTWHQNIAARSLRDYAKQSSKNQNPSERLGETV